MDHPPPITPQGLCPQCGYNLTGICPEGVTTGHCPECGSAFNLKYLPQTTATTTARQLLLWLVTCLAAGPAALGLTLGGLAIDLPSLSGLSLPACGVTILVVSLITAARFGRQLAPRDPVRYTLIVILIGAALSVAGVFITAFITFGGCVLILMSMEL